jgi:D-alanyl-D-alanine carboxypeptidase/D-alanyl-D-alanine-endopeptidase (penicillin-binding protein 4)
VHGNLVVHAADDPSLLRKHLAGLAAQVRAAGVRRVTGHLHLDVGRLPLRSRQSGWKSDFVPADIGPLSPFPVQQDRLHGTSHYLAHPTRANLGLFRSLLEAHGVHVVGGADIVRSTTANRVVASHASEPLQALLKHTLRQSDNFYAESLLAVAGGLRAVRSTEGDAGVTATSTATDGSGLSYDDRQTALGEVQLLRYAYGSDARYPLLRSLPVACRSGTLKDRYCGTPGAGMVIAKTGTLTHSRVLAGYTTDALGRHVTFAVICAGVRDLSAAAAATDRAVLLLRAYDR